MKKYIGYRDKSGFTLIELIIGIALLAILSVTMLPIFVMGAKTINSTGKDTQNYNTAQAQTESIIYSDSYVTSSPISPLPSPVPTPTPVTISLQFSGTAYPVSGRKVVVDYNYGNTTKNVISFTVDN